jgi:hypothetical protein
MVTGAASSRDRLLSQLIKLVMSIQLGAEEDQQETTTHPRDLVITVLIEIIWMPDEVKMQAADLI